MLLELDGEPVTLASYEEEAEYLESMGLEGCPGLVVVKHSDGSLSLEEDARLH